MVSLFLGWYFLYVLASAFARDLMAYRLFGNINVALVFGVLQFASAFVLAWRHTRYAREVLDPLAAQIVADAEERVGEAVRRRAAAPPSGERPYLGPTPPDGTQSPPDPAARPGTASPPRPSPWPETATRPWTGGTR
ncbi:DUF485 domain-containing protein [Actinoallomurus purpureus]|nr:DUF485 domain-containing protein [Actinoallomurus purpureus]